MIHQIFMAFNNGPLEALAKVSKACQGQQAFDINVV